MARRLLKVYWYGQETYAKRFTVVAVAEAMKVYQSSVDDQKIAYRFTDLLVSGQKIARYLL